MGRLSDPRVCWCPKPLRPVIKSALVREYKYVFGAVCPKSGHIDYMLGDDMKTESMSKFLEQVSVAHPSDYMLMVVDGASSHKAKALVIPDNIELLVLPPYSPELNPSERLWAVLRRDGLANRYFDSLEAATQSVVNVLEKMNLGKESVSSLTNFPWIDELTR
jgi:transposase